MACRALCTSLRRRARYMRVARGYIPTQSELLLSHFQGTHSLPLISPSHLSARNPFSASPLLSKGDEAEEGTFSTWKEEANTNNNTAFQELGDGSMDINSPVDLMVACLDSLHNLTGLPWWATISISAIALRALLFPSRIMQNNKLAQIKKLGPKLQLERLAKGASQGKFLEEYRHLRKRQHGLSCPSLLWIIGPGIFIQIPLVLTIMYSLRKMALEQHLGFVTGGILWFKDLTVSGHGLTGAVLPLVIATTYLGNVHVLFQGHPVRQGPMGTLEKAWKTVLKCSTVLIFLSFYHVPQAAHMFFVPHSIMTLSQTMLFDHAKFAGRMIGPKATNVLESPGLSRGQHMKDISSYEKLLKDAGTHFSSGNFTQAVRLLENAIEEEPEEEQAYALLGLVYKTNKDWVNSAVYYQHAILKGKTDDFKIAAYAGCGLALLKQGAVMECVETMTAIKGFKVPEHPDTRHCYYASLIILGRALFEAGLKDESQEIMQLAKDFHAKKSG